jgi:pimeloyl-ACP methyl ester carboxylesterase
MQLEVHPEREEDVMVVLSYFDPMNFAVDIRCPTLVGLGLEDDVVPAPTVYAIANHLSGSREVVRLPVSHTDRPEEKLWDRFEAYWLRLATRGVPRTSERTENDRSRRSRRRSPDLVGGGDTTLAHPPPKVTRTLARAMTATTEMAVAVPNSVAPAKVPPRL